MDRPRTDQAHRRRKRWIIASGIALVLAGLTLAVTRLKPAAPTVERSLVWIDTVKRGEMLREVRGIGTLVPEQISWIAARSAGRVDRILLHPGATVKPEDVILILSNPAVGQAAADSASQLTAAEADLRSFKVQLESGLLAAESTAVAAKADDEQAKLRAQVNEELFKKGLVYELEMKLSKVTAEQAGSGADASQALPDAEAEPIFGQYLNGLTLLAKTDLHLSVANQARDAFVLALRRALVRFGDMESEDKQLLPVLHRVMEPLIPAKEHRNLVFAGLEAASQGSVGEAAAAKRAADLYLAVVARRLWPDFVKRAAEA